MNRSLKVGGWVMLNSDSSVIRRVNGLDIDPLGTIRSVHVSGHYSVHPNSVTPVDVSKPRRRRTLTLSKGMAWLARHTQLGLTTFEVDRDDDDGKRQFRWCVWNFDDKGWFVQESNGAAKGELTPCKAIIAARKQIGVKP